MQFIRGLYNLKSSTQQGCALAIGNFDGVHRGHQTIIKQLRELAQAYSVPSMLLTFEPLPREVLFPAQAPARLNRLREKLFALNQYGLDQVLCMRFDKGLSQLSAEYFIEHILVQKLNIKALVIGDDFRFGYQGQGNIDTLRRVSQQFDYQVVACDRFELHERRVSSSWIRETLAQGQLELCTELLGRPYSIQGRIAYGDQIGRSIGFPTANIRLLRDNIAVSGVFAVRVHGLQDRPLMGVANVGKRPTISGMDFRLEVHIFDFNDTIYGRRVSVELVHKIRSEQKFASLNALKQQIQHDATQAQIYFATR